MGGTLRPQTRMGRSASRGGLPRTGCHAGVPTPIRWVVLLVLVLVPALAAGFQ